MVYEFLADGFEELEAFAPIDILRRAGVKVVTVGVGKREVTGSHGIPVTADIASADIALDDSVEMIVLPGGMPGTLNLEANDEVQRAIAYCSENGKYIAGICAAPSILGHLGLLEGKEAICFPGFEKDLKGAVISDKYVVDAGQIVTARGAGVCIPFALKLVEKLVNAQKAEEIRAGIQTP
ncbi:MAG: DJ-1/PfpI family protein [Ruminococcus sp.]|nr:DJ-1/PfpI family protein [Ruminococcus sp.]